MFHRLLFHWPACNHEFSHASSLYHTLNAPPLPPTYSYIQMCDTRVELQYSCKLPCSSVSNIISLHAIMSTHKGHRAAIHSSSLCPLTYSHIQMCDTRVVLQCSCKLPCSFFSNLIILHAIISAHKCHHATTHCATLSSFFMVYSNVLPPPDV